MQTYRNWSIDFDPKPIPSRDFDWTATSPDYDVDCDLDGPFRCAGDAVYAATYEELTALIDEAMEEED